MTKHIAFSPYNPAWPKMFEAQALLIQNALGAHCVALHHVGSTSVPGLAAKPTIDICAVVKSGPGTIKPLENAGFTYKGEWNVPFKYGFTKRGELSVNLHVHEEGHPEIAVALAFRDYLRTHPDERDAYAALKKELLQDERNYTKQGTFFAGYTLKKDAFIRRVLKATGFQGLRFTRCEHLIEWETAQKLGAVMTDPSDQRHVHFVLQQGIEVIGYAHIEDGALKLLAIEENKKSSELEAIFEGYIERWLKQK